MEINPENQIIIVTSSSSDNTIDGNPTNLTPSLDRNSSFQAVHDENVDDYDLNLLFDEKYVDDYDNDDDINLLFDEKYAEELQLQEAIIFSSTSVTTASSSQSSSSLSVCTMKQTVETPVGESTKIVLSGSFCDICLDSKTESEIFQNKDNVCTHLFCSDCIIKHVAEKIKLNFTVITCPDPNCKGVIGPESCQSIVPKEVLERWESALCESLITGSEKFYCPFKDCSAMLIDDGGEAVTTSECPYCHRLFCAQCKVAWHSDLDCNEFKSLKNGESDSSDILLMDLAKNKKWMRCPRCKFFVERIDGCLHITCRCKYEFCYGCGEDYDNGKHACAPV